MLPVKIILLLITVVSMVAPVGTVIVIYRDDLTQLVITPEIKQILNGDLTFLFNSDYIKSQNETAIGNLKFIEGVISPDFVDSTFDYATGTFTGSVNITDVFKYDLTINSLKADVVNAKDSFSLTSINLTSPVTIPSGETSLVTIKGILPANAEDYLITNYAAANSLDVNLVNFKIDINGIVYQPSEPINLGNIPFSTVGA